ncbi:MAG: hypothetical protein M1837_000069 [Sclerophora amabilis]|nr:MAG: hypothetical protein M1837_000069 [Sclerophora amabilis]
MLRHDHFWRRALFLFVALIFLNARPSASLVPILTRTPQLLPRLLKAGPDPITDGTDETTYSWPSFPEPTYDEEPQLLPTPVKVGPDVTPDATDETPFPWPDEPEPIYDEEPQLRPTPVKAGPDVTPDATDETPFPWPDEPEPIYDEEPQLVPTPPQADSTPTPATQEGPDPKPGYQEGPDPKPGNQEGPDPKPGNPEDFDFCTSVLRGPSGPTNNSISCFLEENTPSSSYPGQLAEADDESTFIFKAWDAGHYNYEVWMGWIQPFMTDLFTECPPPNQRIGWPYDRFSESRFQYDIPADMQSDSGFHTVHVGFSAEVGVLLDDVTTAFKHIFVQPTANGRSMSTNEQRRASSKSGDEYRRQGNIPYKGTEYFSMKGIRPISYEPSDSNSDLGNPYRPEFTLQITAVRPEEGKSGPPPRPVPVIRDGTRLRRKSGACSSLFNSMSGIEV